MPATPTNDECSYYMQTGDYGCIVISSFLCHFFFIFLLLLFGSSVFMQIFYILRCVVTCKWRLRAIKFVRLWLRCERGAVWCSVKWKHENPILLIGRDEISAMLCCVCMWLYFRHRCGFMLIKSSTRHTYIPHCASRLYAKAHAVIKWSRQSCSFWLSWSTRV